MVRQNYKFIVRLLLIVFIILIGLFIWFISYNNSTLVIGSKNFTEQRIVAEMIAIVIEEDTDLDVQIKSGLGETSFLNQALIDQDIDLYVDYSSNGYLGVLKQTYDGESSEEINDYLNTEYNERFDTSWISFLGFENTNAIICLEYCEENNITSINDLENEDFSFAAPANFYERSDGFNLLEEGYNIDISESNKLKMDSVLIYQAVSQGDVDAGLAFTTDGRLQNDDYDILMDTKNIFPKYDAGIVVNNDSLNKDAKLEEVLLEFNDLISTEEMSELNYQVDILGEDIHDVAKEFLIEKNIIGE